MSPPRDNRDRFDGEATLPGHDDETLTARVDVRAAFDDDPTRQAVFPMDDAPPQERTLPMMQVHTQLIVPAPSPAPIPQPHVHLAPPVHVPHAVESEPARPIYPDDDEPYVPPGVGTGRARRIAFGVLGVCVVICVAAGARKLVHEAANETASSTTTATTATTATIATTTEAPTAAATSAETAPPAIPTATASQRAAAASSQPVPIPSAPAAAAVAHRPASVSTPAPAPRPADPPAPKRSPPPTGAIVRDNPF